jgi:ribosomal subunit interface protein
MEIKLTSPHMKITDSLRQATEEKFIHLHRFDNRIISIDVNFDVQRDAQTAAATLSLKGSKIHATAESEDMYQSVSLLVKKLERQLKTHKEKRLDHRE